MAKALKNNIVDDSEGVEVVKTFTLPNKKVQVKPVIWEDEFIPKNHAGSWRYPTTGISLCVPIDRATGVMKDPLTEEERNFFESEASGLDFKPGDLSPYKKENNYWAKKRLNIPKPSDMVNDDTLLLELDLSNPIQYLDYAVIRANTGYGAKVAPNKAESRNQKNRIVYLTEETLELLDIVKKSELRKKAYIEFDKVSNSPTQMFNILYILYLDYKGMVMPSKNMKREHMVSLLDNVIMEYPQRFLAVVNDPNFETKVLVTSAIADNFLTVTKEGIFASDGTTYCGGSLQETLKFFNDPKNQEFKLKLIALTSNE